MNRGADTIHYLASPTLPAALRREEMTLAEHFRRDHFPSPAIDRSTWTLAVTGHVRRPFEISLDTLRPLGTRSERVVLECAGHRRREQRPPAPGLPWETGAIGELVWTGVELQRVLRRAGVLPGATAVILEGADRGEVETGGVEPFARALPMDKALDPDTLLAYEVDDGPIPVLRGGPVRAIVPGWYATDSVKWLCRLTVTDRGFDGYFEAVDYRIASLHGDDQGERMTDMCVHALITAARPGEIAGIAWSAGAAIRQVEVRVGCGEWQQATLGPDRGRYARRFWSLAWDPEPGAYTIQTRARDAAGRVQPLGHVPNRYGYGNNCAHRIEVQVD